MTSGVPLSEEEKEKIRREIKYKFKSQLAKELGRSQVTIRKFVRQEGLDE